MVDAEKTELTVPETISMTESDVDRMGEFKVLRKKWFQLVVTGVKKRVCKTGKYEIDVTCSPVDAEGRPFLSASARLKLYPPIANPEKPGHEVAKPKSCYFFARSIDKNFPRYAKKHEAGKYLNAAGEIITAAQAKQLEREVNSAVGRIAVAWYNNPAALLQETFYGCVDHDVDETTGNIYPIVKFTRMDPPETAEVITSDFTNLALDAEKA